MHRRGRSRIVSKAALARQASEERHRTELESQCRSGIPSIPDLLKPLPTELTPLPLSPPTPDASPCPIDKSTYTSSLSTPSPPSLPSPDAIHSDVDMPSNYYDSPPSPPTSLEDQVHVAYALDNIHLAKILLLKLKGVEVTSDDDPRIDAVKDEDFDICFVPSGRSALEEAEENVIREAKLKERERWKEEQRAARLRACERSWNEEKQRLRREKLRIMKRREEETLALERERRRRDQEKEAAEERIRYLQRLRVGSTQHPRRIVSYSSLTQQLPLYPCVPQSQPIKDEPFQYKFMLPCATPAASPPTTKPKKPSVTLPPPSSMGTSVSFSEVLTSMHGPLFPSDEESVKSHSYASSDSAVRRRRNIAQFELLDSLLKVVEWNEQERRRLKGKAPARERTPSRPDAKCAACSASALSAPTSSSSSTGTQSAPPSRTSSWLSFGSRTSVSTAATSPSVSPISSWLKKSTLSSSPLPQLSSTPPDIKVQPLRHSCHSRLTNVDPAASPLDLALCEPRKKQHERGSSRRQLLLDMAQDPNGKDAGTGKTLTLLDNVSKTLSCFVELAKGFQTVSISATVFSVVISPEVHVGRERQRKLREEERRRQERTAKEKSALSKLKLNPPGYRVHASDASIFLADNTTSPSVPSSGIYFIYLLSPEERASSSLRPRTTLSAPRDLVFPPPPPLIRSPLRPREPPPPGSVLWRMRPVANPVQLRLKALQNVLGEQVGWEGRGREGGLGAGRERLCRVAFEGLGRSALSVKSVTV